MDFYCRYPVLDYHKRVLNALSNCRTAALGGHVEQCYECGEILILKPKVVPSAAKARCISL